MDIPQENSLWLHKKEGGVYRVTGVEEGVVFYRRVGRTFIWRLGLAEFCNRFQEVTEPTPN